MTDAVIFDIDGTLSDPTHRLYHVKTKPYNWPAFFDAMGADGLHEPISDLLARLKPTAKILLTTGRPETHRAQTEEWLARHGIEFDGLYMRSAQDYRPDHVIKSQILDGILADGYEVLFVVDDRQSVVDMWRERGLTCLQCRKSDDKNHRQTFGLLTLMVGPSGAGKSTWLYGPEASDTFAIRSSHIVSSDLIRADLCGDFRDQTRNEEVFEALHAVVYARISHGLPVVVDATNIRRKDRLAIVALKREEAPVRYIVIDRSVAEKKATGGWRNELPIDLISKHDQTFRSNLKDILAGDGLANVTVIDLRENK